MMKRTRSPNYPSLTLDDAIERARALYGKAKLARLQAEDAVQTWGYSSVNGASARVLSALRQYGLLEDVAGDVKLSPRAITLLLEPEDSDDYRNAILSAAEEPGIFREIIDEFSEGLPPENTLVSYLVRKRGFAEDGARKLSAVLRGTMSLAEQFDTSQIENEQPELSAQAASPARTSAARPTRDTSPTTEERQVLPTAAVTMEFKFALPNGQATLSYVGEELTQDDVDILAEFLKITTSRSMKSRITARGSALELASPPHFGAQPVQAEASVEESEGRAGEAAVSGA